MALYPDWCPPAPAAVGAAYGTMSFSSGGNLCDKAIALICTRQNVSPKRLADPGPSTVEIERLLHAAAAAPDHGLLVPWRFVIVPTHKRALLAQVFASVLIERDGNATLDKVKSATEKAFRAPLLILAIARLGPDIPNVPAMERLLSLGAAVQNLLLAAHAMGFGAGLTSGQSLHSPQLRALFHLAKEEQPVCWISIGWIKQRAEPRIRPHPGQFATTL